MESVRGSQEFIQSIEVSKTTVYIRSNIRRIETMEFEGWEYDEEQFPIENFIADLRKENDFLKIEQTQTNTTLLEFMEVVLIGGM
jgi:hypothetical protein